MQRMNYIIFGGSGFFGAHLVNLIRERNPDAVIYNLDIVENDHGGKAVYIKCDVRYPIAVSVPCAGAGDVIFNMAAIHRTPGHQDIEYFETNIPGARNVTDFAARTGINNIVFTSSIAPYGASEELKKEDTLPTPNTPYGISKLVAEKMHETWQNGDAAMRKLLILRPGVVFGHRENGNFTRLYAGLRKRTFAYPGRKDTVKACIYVKDLVSFMLFQIERQQSGVCLFNCTYEPAFTIEHIVEHIKRQTGLKRWVPLVNGNLLKTAAAVIGPLGGKKIGIHPDRVKKLMISTNICGRKMAESGYEFKYSLDEAFKDWLADSGGQELN